MVVTHLNGSDRWSIGAVAQMGLLLLFVDIKCGSSGEDSPRVLFVLPNGRIILNGGRAVGDAMEACTANRIVYIE